MPFSAARLAIISPTLRAASLFPPLPFELLVQGRSCHEGNSFNIVDDLGVDVFGGAEYIQARALCGAGNLAAHSLVAVQSGFVAVSALFTICHSLLTSWRPYRPCLPCGGQIRQHSWIPLPLYGSGGRFSRTSAANWPTFCLSGPRDHDLVRGRALNRDTVNLRNNHLMGIARGS